MLNHPLAEFELSRRTSRAAYRRLQRIGLVCLLLVGFIAAGWPTRERNLIMMLLGLLLGLYLVVKGAHDLYYTDHPRTRIGDRLAHSTARWFPPLAYLAQHAYMVLAAMALWFTLLHLGLEAEPREHYLFFSLLALAPLKRFTRAALLQSPNRWRLVLDEITRLFLFLALLSAGVRLAYHILVPDSARYVGGPPVVIVLIWLAATLCALTQIVLTLQRLTDKDPYP